MELQEANLLMRHSPPGIRPRVRIDQGVKRQKHARKGRHPHKGVGMLMEIDGEVGLVKPDKHGLVERIPLRYLSNWKSKNAANGIHLPEEDNMVRQRIDLKKTSQEIDDAVQSTLDAMPGVQQPLAVGTASIEPPHEEHPPAELTEAEKMHVLYHVPTKTFWEGTSWVEDPERAKTFTLERFAKTARTGIANRDETVKYEDIEVMTVAQAVERYLYPNGMPPAPEPLVPLSVQGEQDLFAAMHKEVESAQALKDARAALVEAEAAAQAAVSHVTVVKARLRDALIAQRQAALNTARAVDMELQLVGGSV